MAVDPFLKHLVFRSFQICQETSANKESIPGPFTGGHAGSQPPPPGSDGGHWLWQL
jgi:hypothetical protein